MSDYDLPDLPSDDELGITEEDRKRLEEQEGEPEPGRGAGAAAVAEPDAAPPGPGQPGKAPPDTKPPEPPTGPPPLGGFRGPVTLLFLLLVTVLSGSWARVPSPAPANAPDTAFSSARAMTHLVEIARRAHPPGSPEHDRVRAYLLDELRSLGLEPSVQTTTSMVRGGERVRAATVRNVLARIPGTASTGAVLITAHYDGRELSKAAGDDGMGVVAILEAVRALRAGEPLRNDVIVLITDAEELGLLGARAFVDQHPWMEEVRLALSLEMRGGGGPSIMFETGPENGWIVDRLREGDPAPVANALGYEVYQRLPNDTDFTPLKEAGVQGLNFAGIDRAHLYHQAYDAPENVSEATLQHHGLHLLGMLHTLGAADLETVDAPDAVYFSLPFLGLVVYPGSFVLPLSGLLLVAFLGVLLWALGKGAASPVGVLTGLLLSGLVGLGAWGAGLWLSGWLPRFHPELGSLHGSAFHSEGWYVLALVAAALFLVTAVLGLVRRRMSLPSLALGGAIVPICAAVAASFYLPLGAMNLQWPALALVLAALVVSRVPGRSRMGTPGWLAALVLAVPVLAFLVSLVEFVWLAMSFTLAPWLAVLVVTVVFLLLPALDALREPNPWWAPATALLAGGAFLGIGLLHADPSPERPLPTALGYALDTGTGEASWVTGEDEPGEADDRSRAWAVERAGAAFSAERELGAFLTRGRTLPSTPAPVIDVAEPQLSVAADSVVEGRRVVRLALRSELGAERVLVRLPRDGPELVAVNGRALPAGRGSEPTLDPPRLVEHWGRPEGSVLLDVRVDSAATAITLELVETHFRPEELLGEEPFRRPPDMAPDITLPTDRALIRTELTVALAPGAAPAATPANGESGESGDEGAGVGPGVDAGSETTGGR